MIAQEYITFCGAEIDIICIMDTRECKQECWVLNWILNCLTNMKIHGLLWLRKPQNVAKPKDLALCIIITYYNHKYQFGFQQIKISQISIKFTTEKKIRCLLML